MSDVSRATARESALIETFADLADTMVDDYDTVDLLHVLVERSVALLDVAAAGLTLADQRGSMQVMAASSEHTRLLELFQLESAQGPCLDAFHTGRPISVDDLNAPQATSRWPIFAPEAVRAGYVSVSAIPMRLRQEIIGALNLFGVTPGPLPVPDLRIAQSLAHTATIGILQERTIRRHEILTEQLQAALNNRIIIEQAKGILAHAGRLSMDQALTALRGYSRHRQTRMSDVADALTTNSLDPRDVLKYQPEHGHTA